MVVVNLSEGEPASAKDSALARHRPHLLLDGAVATARAVGSDRVTSSFQASASWCTRRSGRRWRSEATNASASTCTWRLLGSSLGRRAVIELLSLS